MSAAPGVRRLWVAAIDGRLFALDAATARAVDHGAPLVWVVADGATLWTIGENGDVVERDASTGRGARTWRTRRRGPIAAAAGLGAVWISTTKGVVRVDAKSGAVRSLNVVGTVNAIERCGDAMWLSQPDVGVRAVDSTGRVVRSQRLTVAPRYLACAGERLWILSEDGRLGWIDARA
jgi:hypothetical protein